MSAGKSVRLCSACQGTNLRLGAVVGVGAFRPANAGFFSPNPPINAFVCLDCGLVGQYKDEAWLEKLRAKPG